MKKSSLTLNVVVDERESDFFRKCSEVQGKEKEGGTDVVPSVVLTKKQLQLGDVLLQTEETTLCIIERKTLADLMASIKDGRYEEQSFRLLHSSGVPPHNIIYLLEGLVNTQLPKPEEKKRMYSALTSLLFFKGFSVIRTSTLQESVDTVLAMADKLRRDLESGRQMAFSPAAAAAAAAPAEAVAEAPPAYVDVVKKCKKENLTRENFGEIVLSQIPGVSVSTAKGIMTAFPHISDLIGELASNPNFFENFSFQVNGAAKKLNRGASQKVLAFLLPSLSQQPLPLPPPPKKTKADKPNANAEKNEKKKNKKSGGGEEKVATIED